MIMAGSEDSASKGLAARSRNRSDSRVTPRGEDRRQAIIDAAAAIIRESGPSGVSHRSVAKRAGCSLSATTYYFDGLEDLLHQAGLVNIGLWASRAERVADRIEAGMVYVNLVGADSPELPFGGFKRSGFGRELGRYGADEFVNKKLIRSA